MATTGSDHVPPSRFNQTVWPADGPHRELLDFLDAVHRRHGCRSLRETGRAIHLSYTRVHDIVRGASLPVDETQVRALVVGLTGSGDPETEEIADHAVELFVKARRARDELDDPTPTPRELENVGTGRSCHTAGGTAEAPDIRPLAEDGPTRSGDPRPEAPVVVARTRRTAATLSAAAAVLLVVAVTVAVTRFLGAPGPDTTRSVDSRPPVSGGSDSSVPAEAVPAPTMRVTAENPGGCSPDYVVEIAANGNDPRMVDNRLWIVSELYADMTRNDPNSLYFAKTPVVLSNGRFTAHINGNTEPGVRTERYLLVASPNDAAHQDLQLSLSSDRAHDDQYPDYRRTRLQLGNTEIATGPDLVQRC